MKKILLVIFSILIMSSTIQAQETTNYLAKAFELLLEGNVESAEKHYIVHKKLTGQTDTDFEAMLEGEKGKSSESWKDECYIVPLDSKYMLAVQKASITDCQELYLDDARQAAKASRLGDFTDWHVPSEKEMSILVTNLSSVFRGKDYFWTTTGNTVVNGSNDTEPSHHIASTFDYVIVRKFLRK